MSLTLLGSGGWIPTRRRETCCALVRDGEVAILLDAGSGVRHLVEQPELLEGAERLEIVLTHFHLDHVIGLSYLPALDIERRLWAPGAWLYDAPSEALLRRLLDPPLFAADLSALVDRVVEIDEGGRELAALGLRARVQPRHSHPTLALRRGDELAYCTDTAYDEGNATFASGVRLLCHEAWHPAAETSDETHTAAGEAARVARAAGVEELLLIHINPLLGSDDELSDHAAPVFERTVVARDLLLRD